MGRTLSWIGLRAAVLAPVLVAMTAAGAWAAPTSGAGGLAYSTSGMIGTDGILGTPAVSFQGVDHGAQGLDAPFSLGNFVVATPSDGKTTTYADTPFTITYQDESDPGVPPLVAKGFLFGTVSGSGKSTLMATLDSQAFLGDPSPSGMQYWTGSVMHSLELKNNFPLALGDATTNQAQTPVMGQFSTEIVLAPEPSSWALFLAATAAVGIRRRSRAAR